MAADKLVLHSINNTDASHCVDIFRRDDGSIGFEEYRRDVEDPGGGWFPVGGHAGMRFETEADAITAAVNAVFWFEGIRRSI